MLLCMCMSCDLPVESLVDEDADGADRPAEDEDEYDEIVHGDGYMAEDLLHNPAFQRAFHDAALE